MKQKRYFPNQPRKSTDLELELRKETADFPEQARLERYEIASNSVDSFTPVSFALADGLIIASQRGREIAFPAPIPRVVLSHIVFGYEEWLQRKYCLPGFLEVEPGDFVIDCGAYVGGFAISAAKIARQVHLFEPETGNFRCIRRNFANAPNVFLNEVGLYSSTNVMNLNISSSSVEHSFLTPDDGTITATKEVPVISLKDYCLSNHVEKIDFLKIEAEGVELEVFDGLGDLKPRKLAIDVSPERDGESPADEFRQRLAARGYAFRQRGNVMFARDERALGRRSSPVLSSIVNWWRTR